MKYWFPESPIERNIWENYLTNILKLPISTDVAIFRLFKQDKLTVHDPLEKSLP